jgi:hypothetical protein
MDAIFLEKAPHISERTFKSLGIGILASSSAGDPAGYGGSKSKSLGKIPGSLMAVANMLLTTIMAK